MNQKYCGKNDLPVIVEHSVYKANRFINEIAVFTKILKP